MQVSRVVDSAKLPILAFADCILIYDRVLEKKFSAWIRRFPRRLSVRSGESLKDLSRFPVHAEKILRLAQPTARDRLKIIAFGGGSVGDFAGFVASVLRRGVELQQVPSTWLAAMDSAHGGKTALNVHGFKNQIGTFYPATTVHHVHEVLMSQPPARIHDAAGEYYKMLLLMRRRPVKSPLSAEVLWRDLPAIVRAKWQIVNKDPLETKGSRHVLNLGHTVGHVLESALRLPHGRAVHLGLGFAVEWSRARGILKSEIPADYLPSPEQLAVALRQVKSPLKWLRRDKKTLGSEQIRFVFIKKMGYPLVQKVPLTELVNEWKRQSKQNSSIRVRSLRRSP